MYLFGILLKTNRNLWALGWQISMEVYLILPLASNEKQFFILCFPREEKKEWMKEKNRKKSLILNCKFLFFRFHFIRPPFFSSSQLSQTQPNSFHISFPAFLRLFWWIEKKFLPCYLCVICGCYTTLFFPKNFFSIFLEDREQRQSTSQSASQTDSQGEEKGKRDEKISFLIRNIKLKKIYDLTLRKTFFSSNFFFFPKPLFPFFPLIQSRVEEANIWIHNFKVSTAFLSIFLRFSDSLFFIWIYSAATRRENSSYWFIDC